MNYARSGLLHGKKCDFIDDHTNMHKFDEKSSLLIVDAQKGTHGTSVQINPMRFLPNLVVYGGEPYAEDGWLNIKIGNTNFMVSAVHLDGIVISQILEF